MKREKRKKKREKRNEEKRKTRKEKIQAGQLVSRHSIASEYLYSTISKEEASNFSKIKTDFDLLHSLLNYTRLKKVTFSHLGRNSGTRFFPDMQIFSIAHYYPLTISRSLKISYDQILRKIQKCL